MSGLSDHRLHRAPEIPPAVDGPMGVERSGLMGCIDHHFRGLHQRQESREGQSPVPGRVGLELGAIGCGDSLSDEVEHRGADSLGLAWHGSHSFDMPRRSASPHDRDAPRAPPYQIDPVTTHRLSPDATILSFLCDRTQATAAAIGEACRMSPGEVRARLVGLESQRLITAARTRVLVPPARAFVITG